MAAGSLAIAAAMTAIALAACGGERAAEPAPEAPREAVATGPDEPVPEEGIEPDGPLDEATARFLLAARFRAAGLRIREDFPLAEAGVEITLDGFDPARRVGYEYIAADERGADLEDGERARLASLADARILVIDSCGEGAAASAAERFLAGIDPAHPR